MSVPTRPSVRSGADRGILDTSTVILLDRLDDPSVLPARPLITAITLAELSVGPLVTDDPQQRAIRQGHLQLAESSFRPLPFDAAAARRFGGVAADLRQAGRKPAARAYDALVAAIALANDLPVYTVNAAHFEGITGLTVRAVPHPSSARYPPGQNPGRNRRLTFPPGARGRRTHVTCALRRGAGRAHRAARH